MALKEVFKLCEAPYWKAFSAVLVYILNDKWFDLCANTYLKGQAYKLIIWQFPGM